MDNNQNVTMTDGGRDLSGDNSSSMGSSSSDMNRSASTTSGGMLTGMFRDRDSAERAYSSLTTRGYTNDDVNLIMSDDTRKKYFDKSDKDDDGLGSKAMEGAGTGSAIGGTLGAIVGAVAAIGTSLLIPGLGILVAGPLAGALAGAGAGGLTGGLIGGLVGSGIPEERAKTYEQGIKEGHIVMGVRPRNTEDADYFENEWRTHQATELHR